ncbi:MAG: glycosyltransferase family 2 protein [Candidatus Roizmanbacteria bacterium]
MVDLSIIILSYNTSDVTERCLCSLYKALSLQGKLSCEVIVVDNGSKDKSVEMLQGLKRNLYLSNCTLQLILLDQNTGYPKGNNIGLLSSKGKYILFLNSDIIVDDMNFKVLLEYFEKNINVGALTVRVNLPSGTIDPASHRGFPTVWNSFCYYFKLEQLFKNIPYFKRIFGGYHLVDKDLNRIHEVDSPTGAFYLTRKSIMDAINGFDETFFMYGEDLDMSFRIKELGYSIIYFPKYQVLHLKYSSGIKIKDSLISKKTKGYFYDAMKIFFDKHYKSRYPSFIRYIVFLFIDLKYRFS